MSYHVLPFVHFSLKLFMLRYNFKSCTVVRVPVPYAGKALQYWYATCITITLDAFLSTEHWHALLCAGLRFRLG